MALTTIDVGILPPSASGIVRLRPLINPEVIGVNKYTHYIEIKPSVIPAGMANADTLQINYGSFYKYNRVNGVVAIVQVPFENPDDTAFNSTTLDVGETGALAGWIAAAQINKNSGTLIKAAYKTGATAVPKDYAADTVQSFTLTAMAGKSLSNLKKGSVIVMFDLFKFPAPIDTDSG